MQLQTNALFADRYRLIEKTGIGGFSEVWKAADQMAGDSVLAIKVYAPERGMDDYGLGQFSSEYSLVMNLNHPHLLTARHFDVWDERPYLVMPYISGGSLSRKMHSHGPFSEQELAILLSQMANALAYLHQRNILHQDIKPDNILIGENNEYLLTDFGISSRLRSTLRKSTASGASMTVAYAPPERFDAKPHAMPAGDVFSLGVLTYELATGDVPWMGSGGMSLRMGAAVPELPDDNSNKFKRLVESMMSVDPEQRPDSEYLAAISSSYLKEGFWIKENKLVAKNCSQKKRQTENFHHKNTDKSISNQNIENKICDDGYLNNEDKTINKNENNKEFHDEKKKASIMSTNLINLYVSLWIIFIIVIAIMVSLDS